MSQRDGPAGWTRLLPAAARVLALAERALGRALGADCEGALEPAPAYRWRQGALLPIAELEALAPEDLIGVERSVRRLRANARALCDGEPALDMLLYGERGTGKSTALRGVLRELAPRGLRGIELDRDDLGALPDLFRQLRGRTEPFVIVCDDLSFDADDSSYRTLKAALDGALESRPPRVCIAATSNRRHLVAERMAENLEVDDLHPGEQVQEKLSLSDRFGLLLPFFAPDQETYLRMVDLHARGLGLEGRAKREEIHARALRVALERGGRSGRTARQACIRIRQDLELEKS